MKKIRNIAHFVLFLALTILLNSTTAFAADDEDKEIYPPLNLDIKFVKQDTMYWCWLATSIMVLEYKGAETPKQCEMLNDFFKGGRSPMIGVRGIPAGPRGGMVNPMMMGQVQGDCCNERNFNCRRRTGQTQEILSLIHSKGYQTQNLKRGLSLEELAKTIHADSPIIAGVMKDRRGGHVIVVSGIDYENKKVTIHDPFVGSEEITFNELQNGKRGRWVETIIIDPQEQLPAGQGGRMSYMPFPGMPMPNPAGMNCAMFNNPMSKMGMGMFNMMKGMPFMGGMAKSMGGKMASMMMSSPQATLNMLRCAKQNPRMIKMMLDFLAKDRGLLIKMANFIHESPILAEELIDLALVYRPVAQFFFAFINPPLYHALTFAMAQSPVLTQKMVDLMEEYAEQLLDGRSRFWQAFFYAQDPANDCDGSELPNERFIYSTFANLRAATVFVQILKSIDENYKKDIYNYLMLGKRPDSVQGVKLHPHQKYYFSYAIIKGIKESILDVFDREDMPDSSSDNPANALLGEFMLEMVYFDDETDQLLPTDYGKSFLNALLFARENGDAEAIEVYNFFVEIFPLDLLLEHLPPQDADAPVPRELKREGACTPQRVAPTNRRFGPPMGRRGYFPRRRF